MLQSCIICYLNLINVLSIVLKYKNLKSKHLFGDIFIENFKHKKYKKKM